MAKDIIAVAKDIQDLHEINGFPGVEIIALEEMPTVGGTKYWQFKCRKDKAYRHYDEFRNPPIQYYRKDTILNEKEVELELNNMVRLNIGMPQEDVE